MIVIPPACYLANVRLKQSRNRQKGEKTMGNRENKTARIVGALFLIAMVASLVGAGLIEPMLAAPDYLSNGSTYSTQATVGVLLELINGIAVIGIAVMIFQSLKYIMKPWLLATLLSGLLKL